MIKKIDTGLTIRRDAFRRQIETVFILCW